MHVEHSIAQEEVNDQIETKRIALDIVATDENGAMYLIEMQVI